MDSLTLIQFFTYCTIIDGSVLILWAGFCMLAPDVVYGLQNRFFPLPRTTYDAIMYAALAVFKILFLIFNLVPLVALLLLGD